MPMPLSGCLGERLDTQRKWHSERAATTVAAPDDGRIERQVLPRAGRSGRRNRRCLAPRHIDRTIKAVVPASVVVAMIFPLGDVSGAHLNPAVTGMFAIRRDCEWKRVPAY